LPRESYTVMPTLRVRGMVYWRVRPCYDSTSHVNWCCVPE